MRSETGNSRGGAFTLLELLVVLFLIVVLSAGAAATLGPGDGERALQAAGVRLSALARRAHREAARSGEDLAIHFDQHGFDLVRTAAEGGGGPIAGHQLQRGAGMELRPWGSTRWEPAAGFLWAFPPMGLSEPLTVRFHYRGEKAEFSYEPLSGAIAD